MKVLKNAVGLTARLRPKRIIQNLAVTKTTIHRAALWSCYLRFVPVSKISISRVFEKIFAFSTQTGQSNFVHRKIFMSFQTQINQSNFLCECGCWKNEVTLCMIPEHSLWQNKCSDWILCDRISPRPPSPTLQLPIKSCLRFDCFNYWLASPAYWCRRSKN